MLWAMFLFVFEWIWYYVAFYFDYLFELIVCSSEDSYACAFALFKGFSRVLMVIVVVRSHNHDQAFSLYFETKNICL